MTQSLTIFLLALVGATAFAPRQATDRSTSLSAFTPEETAEGLFKAGLFANLEQEAAVLASSRIKSVDQLGWKGTAKRRGNARPRHWAFGGAGEKAVQDKPNYDESSPLCVEKWLSLADFYQIVKDDSAAADTIFVALAKGGAFVEREVAEQVLDQWYPTAATPRQRSARTFDEAAFLKTVQQGRQDFLVGWGLFGGITGLAVTGIVFPTNPFQLALVDLLESITHNDAKIAAGLV